MSKKPKNNYTISSVKALLARYACPIPYHQVRAQFMGSVMTPNVAVVPTREVQRIWNDEIPIFKTESESEEFFDTLIQGLWYTLGVHQEPKLPFRLSHIATDSPSLNVLNDFARIRREEIKGFIDGLFVGRKNVPLPERVIVAVDILADTQSLFADTKRTASKKLIAKIMRNFHDMTNIAETEINISIQTCKKAKLQPVQQYRDGRPVVVL